MTLHFSFETMEATKKCHNIVKVVKIKELLTRNSIFSETILQKRRGNRDILIWKNTNKNATSKIILKEWLKVSSNRKEIMEEGILEN